MMPRKCTLILVLVMVVAVAPPVVAADSISLAGTSIPIGGCTIESIRQGRVIYLDARGQRTQRPLDEISALSFDGLDALDRAEALIAERDYTGGIAWLLKAALETRGDRSTDRPD